MYFIQASSGNSTDLFIYLVIGIVGLLITAVILRWIFKVGKRTKIEKAQLEMLEQIARQSGVPDTEIKKIMDKANEPWDKP
jgi:hypothetical protein